MPLRIDSTHQSKGPAVESSALTTRGSEFSQALVSKQKLQRQELDQFFTRLDEVGQRLSQSLSLHDLADFRDLVKTMLRSTFGQSRTMGEESLWDYRGRPKVMARIQKVDQALEDLGKKVLDEQSKPMEILTKIDEIRGLIIDLLA